MKGNTPAHDSQPRTPHARAAVVGAGIAGLAAAVALRRAGWDVEVFERSRFRNEVGAAITVPPNAAGALARWGFDFGHDGDTTAATTATTAADGNSGGGDGWEKEKEGTGPVPNEATRYATAHDLREVLRAEYPHTEAGWGCGSWSFHRVDLHRALRELATGAAGDTETTPVQIRLGCEVRGVDCERGVLSLADGTAVRKDLVVIADGAHSRLISDFVGRPTTAQPTGRSIYRWLVSLDEVMADEELRGQFDGEPPGFLGWHDLEKRVLWVNYTCRGGRVLNNAVMHNTEAGEGEDDLWHSFASKEQVLGTLANFHPAAQKIVHMATEDGIKVHRLFKRPPLDSFVRGRAVVVGDAAHVMMPTHAAGGGIAIESAASLEVLLGGVDGADEQAMEERLRLFDELRLPRCNLTQIASNAGPEWIGVPGVEEEIRKYYSGPLPPEGSMPWSDEFREVLFHHDEFEAAEKALESVSNGSKT